MISFVNRALLFADDALLSVGIDLLFADVSGMQQVELVTYRSTLSSAVLALTPADVVLLFTAVAPSSAGFTLPFTAVALPLRIDCPIVPKLLII